MRENPNPTPAPLRALRHHVTGAIERGTAEPIAESPANDPAADPFCPRCGFRESSHGKGRGPYICR